MLLSHFPQIEHRPPLGTFKPRHTDIHRLEFLDMMSFFLSLLCHVKLVQIILPKGTLSLFLADPLSKRQEWHLDLIMMIDQRFMLVLFLVDKEVTLTVVVTGTG
jgi:hypothetical protein